MALPLKLTMKTYARWLNLSSPADFVGFHESFYWIHWSVSQLSWVGFI